MSRRAWSFVLDAVNTIVQVGEEEVAAMAPFLGHSLWDYLPHGEEVLGPHFDEARRTAAEVEATVFYAGGTVALRLVPSGEVLVVHATRKTELDVRTLGTLAASLRTIERELAARAPAQPDRRALGSRQALP